MRNSNFPELDKKVGLRLRRNRGCNEKNVYNIISEEVLRSNRCNAKIE